MVHAAAFAMAQSTPTRPAWWPQPLWVSKRATTAGVSVQVPWDAGIREGGRLPRRGTLNTYRLGISGGEASGEVPVGKRSGKLG